MEKLSIFHILISVKKDLELHRGVLFKRLIILALILAMFESLSGIVVNEISFSELIAYWLIYGMVFTLFAVTCHRVIILGSDSVPKYGMYSITKREVRFYGWGVFNYFYMSLVTFIMMLPFGFFSLGTELNGRHWVFIIYIACIPGTYIFSRLSILFPATAVDQRKDINWAWETTKGNGWRLLILLGVLPVVIGIIPRLFAGNSFFIDMAVNFLGSIVAAFEIALLSHAYKYLSARNVKSEEQLNV